MNYKKMTKVQAKNFADDIDALPEAAFLDLEANGKNTVWTILILHIPT